MLPVYRQCRNAFHVLASTILSFVSSEEGDAPSMLMALSTERWPTWLEMFPGIREDALEPYGAAARLSLPGLHINVINRCLGNQDATFTGVAEHFLSDA